MVSRSRAGFTLNIIDTPGLIEGGYVNDQALEIIKRYAKFYNSLVNCVPGYCFEELMSIYFMTLTSSSFLSSFIFHCGWVSGVVV